MNALVLLAFSFFLQGEVPFKKADEFQVEIDLKFKPRPATDKHISYSGYGNRMDESSGVAIPFLAINVRNIKILPDEIKMRAVDSHQKTIFKRKSAPDDLHIEMGFVEDILNGEAANEVTIFFISAEKKQLRKIVMTVMKDGTFEVNGKWHGKF